MPEASVLESVIKRDRLIVLTALVAIVAISWIYLLDVAADMQHMAAMELVRIKPWDTL